MKERLKKILYYYGLTPSEFALRIGIQKSTLSHIFSGRNKPSLDLILKIVDTFSDINLYWLAKGEGKMIIKKETISTQKQIFKENEDFKSQEKSLNNEINEQKNELIKETSKEKDTIEKVMIFYTNGTFKDYSPKKN